LSLATACPACSRCVCCLSRQLKAGCARFPEPGFCCCSPGTLSSPLLPGRPVPVRRAPL
jgi:hypothetical protein